MPASEEPHQRKHPITDKLYMHYAYTAINTLPLPKTRPLGRLWLAMGASMHSAEQRLEMRQISVKLGRPREIPVFIRPNHLNSGEWPIGPHLCNEQHVFWYVLRDGLQYNRGVEQGGQYR